MSRLSGWTASGLPKGAERTQLVTFHVGEDLFAADIFSVERVLRFTAPRLDTLAWQSAKQRTEASLANRNASPIAAFSDTLNEADLRHRILTSYRLVRAGLTKKLQASLGDGPPA